MTQFKVGHAYSVAFNERNHHCNPSTVDYVSNLRLALDLLGTITSFHWFGPCTCITCCTCIYAHVNCMKGVLWNCDKMNQHGLSLQVACQVTSISLCAVDEFPYPPLEIDDLRSSPTLTPRGADMAVSPDCDLGTIATVHAREHTV